MEPFTSSKIATAGIAKRRESGAKGRAIVGCLPARESDGALVDAPQ